MNIQIFGTRKCFDTKKAQRWFQERRIKFQFIDLAQKAMSRGEFDNICRAVGGMQALINTKAKDYASWQYTALEEDRIALLLDTPALMCTPVVRNGKQATIGYCPEAWTTWA